MRIAELSLTQALFQKKGMRGAVKNRFLKE